MIKYDKSMLLEIKDGRIKIIKFVIKEMGCGALSASEQVFTPELQFRKLKAIHKSQESEIWTCENKSRQKFSVKVFKKIFIHEENQSMLKNFQLEINRLYGLAHSAQTQKSQYGDARVHLVPYIRAWKDESSNLCLTMQQVEQCSLGEEVKGKLPGLFTEPIVAKLTEQAIQTIKFLRSHGSIFCNFKPSNAFLSKDRTRILLTDYYNLEQYFKLSQTSISKSPIYSAPENILFNQYFMQTDVWRVGCFVLEMLTCIKPWYKETTSGERIVQCLKGMQRPPLPEKVSKECKNFLQKCFETDHNRRVKLQELLYHEFITLNSAKCEKMPQVQERPTFQRENTSIQQIASYKLQIQLMDSPPHLSKKTSTKRKQVSFPTTERSQLSPLQSTKKLQMKKPTPNFAPFNHKEYETCKVVISENDQNLQKSTVSIKRSRNFRSRRMKTQAVDAKPMEASYVSPYSREKKSKQILQMLNRKKAISIANPYDSPTSKQYTISKKVSRTSNHRVNKSSKKKIPTNQITLNNEVVQFAENGSTKYWASPQRSAPLNYLQTAEKLNQIMKEIEMEGGQKYYRKPLKLLKQKLKGKYTLRTETSITLEDSRALMQKDEQEMERINLQENAQNDEQNQPQTQLSKISYQTSHENQVIQTLTSKAIKQRFQTQRKMLLRQREEEKQKWQQELKQGREFIKNEFNRRYYVPRKDAIVSERYE